MLSLCMIVKDEENTIIDCLEAVKNFVDEIIIVDTGSSDSTKEKAKSFTDKIFDFNWCSDFSKARNFSIEKASNDWVIVLDADELLVEFNTNNLRNFFSNPKSVGRVEIINYFDDSNLKKKYIERVNRIFNRKFFKYEGTIHEQIVSIEEAAYQTELIDVVIDHVGYTKEVIERTNKVYRNIKMLSDSLNFAGEDSYIYYQLGKSYYMLKDYKKAISAFENALMLDVNINLEYVEDLIETYGYAMLNTGAYKQALKLLEFKDSFNDSCDFQFLIALTYMNNGFINEAIKCFKRCTLFEKCKIHGVNSYMAYYNLGVIFECMGEIREAIHFYKKCGEYDNALNRLKKINL